MKKIIEKIKSQGKEEVNKTIQGLAIVTTLIVVGIWLVLINMFQNKRTEPRVDPVIQEIQESLGSFEESVQDRFPKPEDQLLIDQTSLFEVNDESEFIDINLENIEVSDANANLVSENTQTSLLSE